MSICNVENCGKEVKSKNLCLKHYTQYYRHGCVLDIEYKEFNEILLNEDHAEVCLYNFKGKLIAKSLIDLEDVERIKDVKWSLRKGYARNTNKGYLHKFIMNDFSSQQYDHINLNKLDNRKANLRSCTSAENMCNKEKYKKNKSGYKGVSWDKQYQKWKVQICKNYKVVCLGRFDDVLEAAECYRKASLEFHLEFGRVTSEQG